MSKYLYAALLSISLFSINGVFADEVSTTTTKTDTPDSSTINSTTVEDRPGYMKSESTKVEATPYDQEVTTKKSYKKVPGVQRTTKTNSETTTIR